MGGTGTGQIASVSGLAEPGAITTLFLRPAPNGVRVSPHALRSMSTSEVTVTESPEVVTLAETESA